jgi:uncharacterized protein
MDPFFAIQINKPFEFSMIDEINILGNFQQTLLQASIISDKYSNIDYINYFINRGIDLNHQDKDGNTALHYAFSYEKPEIARALIDAKCHINLYNKHGNNAMWTACLSPRPQYDLIQLLLDLGADIQHKNNAGKSVLDIVSEMNYPRYREIFAKFLR